MKRLATKVDEPKKQKLTQSKLPDYVESTKLTSERFNDINRSLTKAFVVCGIPYHIIENLFFVELLRPGYELPSKDVLSDHLLAQETAFVNQAIIKKLKNSENFTLGIVFYLFCIVYYMLFILYYYLFKL